MASRRTSTPLRSNPYRPAGCRPRPMVLLERANPTDRLDVERLIAAYLTSEGVKPRPERITWAVEQVMKNRVGGVILVAREKKAVVGVALAVYSPSAEEGRLLVLNDFFVDPGWRRKGVGRALATRLLEEAKAMRVERIAGGGELAGSAPCGGTGGAAAPAGSPVRRGRAGRHRREGGRRPPPPARPAGARDAPREGAGGAREPRSKREYQPANRAPCP